MKNFILSKAVVANQLISEGVKIEFEPSNSEMKLYVSDKLLKIFECQLIEEDYPKSFLDTSSVLILLMDKSFKSVDDPIYTFTTLQSDDLLPKIETKLN